MSYLTRDQFEDHLLMMRKAPFLPIDTEGTLNHPYSTTWGLSTLAFNTYEYFGFNHTFGENLPQSWLAELKDVVENHKCLVFHHAKHDLRALRSLGINYSGKFYDVMLMAHMNNENIPSKALDYLSRYFGGDPKNMPDVMKAIIEGFGWDYVPVDMMRSYAENDALITGELFYKLIGDFKNQGFDGDLWDREQKFVRLLGKIEDTGVLIDQDLAMRELERGTFIMRELERYLGFNPASTTQLGNFLLEELGLPIVKKTPKNKPSFDKEAMAIYDAMLQQRNDKRAQHVLAYRGWQKTTSSNYRPYLELLYPQDGRLHPNFKMHGTLTSRLSCEKPNLQQIPKESIKDWNGHTKSAITTERGRRAWQFDYSQLEFRIGAAYAGEQRLIEIFNDPTRDIFDEMALDLGMRRDPTKTLNYILQFGGRANRIKHVFGVTHEEAQGIVDNYFDRYPGLLRITKVAEKICRDKGFVRLWTGRRRHIKNPDEWRKAFNSICQGGGAEIVKSVMLDIDDAGLNNDECRMDLQVHDALRFSIEEGKEDIYIPEIKNIMENVKKHKDFGVEFRVAVEEWASKSKEMVAA